MKKGFEAFTDAGNPEESNLKVTYSGTRLIWWAALIVLHIPRPEYGLDMVMIQTAVNYCQDKESALLKHFMFDVSSSSAKDDRLWTQSIRLKWSL